MILVSLKSKLEILIAISRYILSRGSNEKHAGRVTRLGTSSSFEHIFRHGVQIFFS